MSQEILALTCVFAPLASFALALIVLRRIPALASGVVVLSGLLSLIAAIALLATRSHEAAALTARWFTIGDISIEFGLLLDGKTLIMGAVVALVTSCIQIYSLSYMSDDPGRSRFFAFLAFFEWSMLLFVYSSSLLQTFIFWELVGLASFFLIGFWYEKPSAIAAAKKAFLMTRIGDVALFIGLILLFTSTSTLDVLGIVALFASEGTPESIASGRIELIALLLFGGVIGKSAQFPLHTWLPDAMEGPTPVSALLHSATMVAAGVFLVARFHELFLDAPTTLTVILVIATITALLASTMALVAKDMKRVLAFSTVSQLAFMLMALGAGSLFAGFFHLTTHALFKALLFLCAGAYIHHLGTNDMIAMGRAGASKMRVVTVGLVVGGAALAGIPPLAGFFSKEQIIGSLGGPGHLVFKLGAFVAAFLTAYYTFRMVFLLVRPNPDSDAIEDELAGAQHAGHEEHHGPAEPWAMRIPILLLTLGAVVAGFFGDRIGHMLSLEHIHHPTIVEMIPAIVIALLGVALAWVDFGRRGARQTGFVSLMPVVQRLFENRWHIDALYNRVFVGLTILIARLCYTTETRGLDEGTDRIADGTVGLGRVVARGHSGRLQFYLCVALIVVAALVITVQLRAMPD
ncbi:MAG: NADH-quinone oxidoreductase subunit L [Planctomycetota bacterium]|jgi:NADH-quinone oxidoreductase subunit L